MKKRLAVGIGIGSILAIFSGILTFNSLLAFLFAGVVPGTNIILSPTVTIVGLTALACLVGAHFLIAFLSRWLPEPISTRVPSPHYNAHSPAALRIPERKIGHKLPPRRFRRV